MTFDVTNAASGAVGAENRDDTHTLCVLDSSYGDIDVETNAAAGVRVTSAHADRGIARDADGVLVQYADVTAEVMDAHPRWQVIGRYGVGVDSIDIDAATQRGIAVVNVPDYCVEEVATHAAALVLAATRKVALADQLIRRGGWNDWPNLRPINRLSAMTLGLIGTGKIGRETARMLRPFFGRIIAFDPVASEIEGIELLGFDEVVGQSDVLSLHCPLTSATHHLLGAEQIALMKPTSYLVNVSRGGLIDGIALAGALQAGQIAGAALDVLETEPPEYSDPLLEAPRVVLTNHLAWYSEESERQLRSLLAERCSRVLNGERVETVVNAAALLAVNRSPRPTPANTRLNGA